MNRSIRCSNGIQGTVTVPGDKSISHRALMFAALANGTSIIRGLLGAADPQSTRHCLRLLGAEFSEKGDDLIVKGNGLHGLKQSAVPLDAGNSGTTMRLMSGMLAGQKFQSILTGDDSLNRRPMKRIIDPLSQMGARIQATEQFTAPLKIDGHFPLTPISYRLPVASAQVKSSIILAGHFADGTTRIVERVPTRDHTERMLGLRTADSADGKVIEVRGGAEIPAKEYEIPGDFSSAAFLIVAGTIVPQSELLVRNVGLNPSRIALLDVLRQMGALIALENVREIAGEPLGDLQIVHPASLHCPSPLHESTIAAIIDEIPILTVLGLFCEGEFVLRHAKELRAKESDRIRALVANLRRLGVEVEEYPDGFAFEGKKYVLGSEIDSMGDHRIAMAFGVAGLMIPGMTIRQSECVDISYPGFWDILEKISQ